jgi:hypothetical protein
LTTCAGDAALKAVVTNDWVGDFEDGTAWNPGYEETLRGRGWAEKVVGEHI